MPDFDYDPLDEIKYLTVTRNEALYLSDSVTLMLEQDTDKGRINMPARHLVSSACIPVPVEVVERIGLAVLLTTEPENYDQTAEIEIPLAELFLLRECCQSFIKVNREAVGYNLLRKIYALILEENLKERVMFDKLTSDITMDKQYPDKTLDRIDENG